MLPRYQLCMIKIMELVLEEGKIEKERQQNEDDGLIKKISATT